MSLDKRLVLRMLWLLLRSLEAMLLANYVPNPLEVPQEQRESGQRALKYAGMARETFEFLCKQAGYSHSDLERL